MGSSRAGNSMMIWAPAGVTIISPSIRAAETLGARAVGLHGGHHACLGSIGLSNEFGQLTSGR
jgi:hypothetical protein